MTVGVLLLRNDMKIQIVMIVKQTYEDQWTLTVGDHTHNYKRQVFYFTCSSRLDLIVFEYMIYISKISSS